MMFDTGGVEAVTPETATALGLQVEGGETVQGSGEGAIPVAVTHITGVRLGDAEMSDLRLPVLPCHASIPTAVRSRRWPGSSATGCSRGLPSGSTTRTGR
jgi:Aspartyl protease